MALLYPDRNSLSSYQPPEWFKNAKFGIWANWAAMTARDGDWYAQRIYKEKSFELWQAACYGHSAKVRFKEVITRLES